MRGRVMPRSFVQIEPHRCMTHDNTAAVIEKYSSMHGGSNNRPIKNPRQLVFTLDHNVQDKSRKNMEKYRSIRQFAEMQGVDNYPAGRGIGHQVMCEEGYVLPGQMIVASDSHSNMYGGLGALGTPIVRTDAAGIWSTGSTWWQIPKVARVNLNGLLRREDGATSKDIIIALCGLFNRDEVLNHAVEFYGSAVNDLSIDDRLTIANMSTEWGALAGIFPADEITMEWLHDRSRKVAKREAAVRLNETSLHDLERKWKDGSLSADKNAQYDIELELDVSSIRPYICGPNHVKRMRSVQQVEPERIAIQKAYIVSCVNSRVEDIASAAEVFRSVASEQRKVADGVELYVAAASSEVETASRERGDWHVLLEAGAKPLPPGCGPCVGLGKGLLQDGEVGISATNRNFKGRMGSRDSEAYLGSPGVVAASAISGYICAPMHLSSPPKSTDHESLGITALNPAFPKTSIRHSSPRNLRNREQSEGKVRVVDGFKDVMCGEVLFCHQDNLDTDGIFAGTHTYKEGMTDSMMSDVVMENYDPQFSKMMQRGDVLVGGFNFGCGSSREQAATSLKIAGIDVVVAGSFSETYKRNAFNNGLLCVEIPELVLQVRDSFGTEKETVRTGLRCTLDFRNSLASLHKEEEMGGDENLSKAMDLKPFQQHYKFSPLGNVAQSIIASGSLEAFIQESIHQLE